MGTMHKEVVVRWEPEWWASGGFGNKSQAVAVLHRHGATSVSISQYGLCFRLALGPLDNLGSVESRLTDIRREVEAL